MQSYSIHTKQKSISLRVIALQNTANFWKKTFPSYARDASENTNVSKLSRFKVGKFYLSFQFLLNVYYNTNIRKLSRVCSRFEVVSFIQVFSFYKLCIIIQMFGSYHVFVQDLKLEVLFKFLVFVKCVL